MNQFAADLSRDILKSPKAWEAIKNGRTTVGYKPKVSYVHYELNQAREALFYDTVYFPHLARLMETVRRWNLLPCVRWEQLSMGYFKDISVWWPATGDQESDLGERIADHMQFYMEPIWNDETWAWEYYQPTEQDLLSLGALPQAFVIQPVLF